LIVLSGATGYATYNDIGGHVMEDVHEAFANSLLVLVFIHIGGVVLSSLVHRENLVRSMLSGYKLGKPGEAIGHRHRVVAAAVIVAIAALWIAGPDSVSGAITSAAHAGAAGKYHSADRRHDD
jgi:hypothetical protein